MSIKRLKRRAFLTVIGAPEVATCLQFAATRLKFAARLDVLT
jgi:hypothetical protein